MVKIILVWGSTNCVSFCNTLRTSDHIKYFCKSSKGKSSGQKFTFQEYERAVIFRLGRVKRGGAVGPGKIDLSI
jgi:hypothetical protein